MSRARSLQGIIKAALGARPMRNEPTDRIDRLTRATDRSIFGDGTLYLCWRKEVKLGKKRRKRARLTPATSDNKTFVYV